MSNNAHKITTLVRSISRTPIRICKWAVKQNRHPVKPIINSNGCKSFRNSRIDNPHAINAEAQESLTDYYNSS